MLYASPTVGPIVESTVDNKFAGLVLTASREPDDSLTTGVDPYLNPGGQGVGGSDQERLQAALWDNQREENEWTEVCVSRRFRVQGSSDKRTL